MRFDSLTIFRYIAALIVVIFHLGKNTDIVNIAPSFLTSGPEMVTFFFVMSGFVMMLSYFNKKKLSKKNYWRKRALRLIPGYIIALLIMIFFLKPSTGMGVAGVILSFLFLQAWLPPFPLFINLPGWAISVEVFFYSIFPNVLLKIKKLAFQEKTLLKYSLIFWLFTQIILTWLLNSSYFSNPDYQLHDIISYFPLSHICSFFLGMAGGYYIIKKNFKLNITTNYSYIFFFSTIIIIFLILQNKIDINNFLGISLPFSSSFLAPLFLVFIFSIISVKNTLIDKLLSLKPLVSLGKISYAFYIFQYPIYAITYKYIFPSTNLNNNLKFYSFILILTIFSFGFTYLIENPTRKLLRKWELKKYGHHH